MARCESAAISKRIQQVISALDNQINQPNQNHLQSLSDSLSELDGAYKEAAFNEVPRTWRDVVTTINLGPIAEASYAEYVRQLIAEKQPLINEAREIIQNDYSYFTDRVNSITSVVDAFDQLKIPMEETKEGDSELRILFPSEMFRGELNIFAKDLMEIERFITTCSEIETGQIDHPKLKQLSTTDPVVMVVVGAPTILFVLRVVDRILDQIIKVQEIRKKQKEIEILDLDKNISDMIGREVQKKIDKMVDDFIEDEKEKIIKSRTSEASNELEAKFRRQMLDVARRIDNGMELEGWAEANSAVAEDSEAQKLTKEIREIAQKQRGLEYRREPTLHLPPPTSDEGDK